MSVNRKSILFAGDNSVQQPISDSESMLPRRSSLEQQQQNNFAISMNNNDNSFPAFPSAEPVPRASSPIPTSPITATSTSTTAATDNYEPIVDEVPLLEELGINFVDIFKRSVFVLNPFKTQHDDKSVEEKDLAGALFSCLILGIALLLRGKVHFGYIYSVAIVCCISIYLLLNVMRKEGVDMHHTASILGYALLPMVLLAMLSIVFFTQQTIIVGIVVIVWCTWSATKMFVTVFKMHDKRWLLAYPIGLVYTAFALITIF